ncbi:IPT/TIG domain-containing protein [Streptomyces pathocidini]|uniref:IPT/TIG domain-containing protein n=1 Tax=Streptomyces pathocidini TaxID=1650571 RepID=A0ABW7UNF1_9ACTN|nr:IPT/TIG domain-containing protein [Streptomyces pathocidini]
MPISPNSGPTGGGQTVTITGSNLSGTTSVKFGSKNATNVTNVSPTTVTAVTPSGAGEVGVTLTTPGGTSNPLPYFYLQSPLISGLSPTAGSTAGGTSVTITGNNLNNATVNFGANPGTVTNNNATSIIVTSPAGAAGNVTVTVTTNAGTVNAGTFTYVADPTITLIDPNSGSDAGGTSVTITGTNLTTTQSVTFDGTTAPGLQINSDTEIVVTTPPGTAGAVDVVVTTSGNSVTSIGGFTYVTPPLI